MFNQVSAEIFGIHEVRGPQEAGNALLGVIRIDGNNALRAGNPCSLDSRQSDCTESHH
ncbi:hypothetical protein D3C86_2206650 [compost metagenome]